MARPKKVGIPYFSLDSDFFEDPKIKLLFAKYGSDGVITYVKILTTAYSEFGYYFPATEDYLLLTSAELKIEYDFFIEMIEFMCGKKLFNVTQKQSNGILTSTRMQLQYLSGTERRTEVNFNSSYLVIDPEREKNKSHKANIVIDGFSNTETQKKNTETELPQYNNPQSESESESEIESKKKVSEYKNFPLETSFSKTSHLEKIKNLFQTHTRISDPNEKSHLEPIVNFYKQVPELLSGKDIDFAITTAFEGLTPNKGVKMEFLLDNIQKNITAALEKANEKRKQVELKEANQFRNEQKELEKQKDEEFRQEKLKQYGEFLRLNPKLFTHKEVNDLTEFLKKNRFLEAGAIVEPKMESIELT